MEDLITVLEASRKYKIHEQTIRRAIRKGYIKKEGKYLSVSDLEFWISQPAYHMVGRRVMGSVSRPDPKAVK